jgi:hypothetical protein
MKAFWTFFALGLTGWTPLFIIGMTSSPVLGWVATGWIGLAVLGMGGCLRRFYSGQEGRGRADG